jgi:hypothetical protein
VGEQVGDVVDALLGVLLDLRRDLPFLDPGRQGDAVLAGDFVVRMLTTQIAPAVAGSRSR